MNITESNKSSQEPQGDNLSVEQLNAIDILVNGKTDQETALVVGVARETVTRCRNDNPHFTAELNNQRRFIWAANHDRLRSLAGTAVDTLEAALDSGDSRIAVEVMKAVGLYGQVKPPSGPVDAELVLWEKAKEWAAAEFGCRKTASWNFWFMTREWRDSPVSAWKSYGATSCRVDVAVFKVVSTIPTGLVLMVSLVRDARMYRCQPWLLNWCQHNEANIEDLISFLEHRSFATTATYPQKVQGEEDKARRT